MLGWRPAARSRDWLVDTVTQLHLTHPDLDLYVDVTVHERGGRNMATADLAEDSRDVGAALEGAITALGGRG